ncbi:heavy-metal-associated domain-containing protein [Chitinophaga lutea]
METLQFKTNIKCTGCLAAVTPSLNETAGADTWQVDLQSADKILTVKTDKADKETIREAVEKAGYKAESL